MDLNKSKRKFNDDFIAMFVDTYASAKNGGTVFRNYKVTPAAVAALDAFRDELDTDDADEEARALVQLTAPGGPVYDYVHFDIDRTAARLRDDLSDDGESTSVVERAQEQAIDASEDFKGPFETAVEELHELTRNA